MQQFPARVVMSAHTDPQGDAPYNLDLSRRRGAMVHGPGRVRDRAVRDGTSCGSARGLRGRRMVSGRHGAGDEPVRSSWKPSPDQGS